MLSFLLAVHFILTITIIGLILLQQHDSDGALGSGGNATSGMFPIRGHANILTRSTSILMTVFILNCLVMAKLTKRTHTKESIIDKVAQESITEKTNVSASQSGNPSIPSEGAKDKSKK